MTQALAYQLGAIFMIAAALMVLSLMRDWIPADIRRLARYATGALALAVVAIAAQRYLPSFRWPSFGSAAPAASIAQPVPEPAPKSTRKARAPKQRPKIREISPEEAERLMEQIRTRQEIPIGR